ncbi:MAG: leucyl aminopeptidase, partial [Eubacterium sp.]|nr:leucyl aminopeptidase [Eubacterium sp.]
MDDKKLADEKMMEILERFNLSGIRLEEIAAGEASGLDAPLEIYFRRVASFLCSCRELYEKISSGDYSRMTLEECREENRSFYRDILPESYDSSYANPDYATEALGEEYGKLLCLLYTELRSLRVCAFEQDLPRMTIFQELFLEIYGMMTGEKVTGRQLRETIYWFFYDYAEEWCVSRIHELMDPALTFAADIVMNSDLTDLRYLYKYGEYVSRDELDMAGFLNSFSREEIDSIARTLTEGYRRGFVNKGVDLSSKDTVSIFYNLGFERIIRAVADQLAQTGLKPLIHRGAYSS